MNKKIISLVGGIGLLFNISSTSMESEVLNNSEKIIDNYVNNGYYNNVLDYGLFAKTQETHLNDDGSNGDVIVNKVYINDEVFNDKLDELLEEERIKQLEIERLEQEELIRIKQESAKQEIKKASEWMTFHATYYTARCKGCSGITKLEIDVRNTIYYNGYRIVAVDPRVIPLRSLIEVSTPHETFIAYAGDIGGAIKGRKLDILVKTNKEAYDLGRHDVKVRIIERGVGK